MIMDQTSPILPAHIEETIKAIAELHAQHHRQATPVQRVVDRSVRFIGQPGFVGLLSVVVVTWIVSNLALLAAGKIFDPPPFQILQDLGELVALYITVLILINQRRDDKISEHREQLTLELAILSEQKSSKIIELLEELRRDSPMIVDRVDPEAEALSTPADPQAVLDAIVETHAEMLAEISADGATELRSNIPA